MRKWILGGVVLVAVAVLAVPLLMGGGGTPSVAAQQNLQTGTVQRQNLNTTVESSGTVVPEKTIYLTFGTSGKVASVNTDVGTIVKAGDVLATLDTADLEYQISLKEQSLAQQQASYDAFMAPPTAQEIAQAQANLASAQANLISAQVAQDTSSNSVTQSCSTLESKTLTLQDAQTAYDQYVTDGYTDDATFIPDPDADVSNTLRNAQSDYDVAKAQCDSAQADSDNSPKVASAQASLAQAQAALDALNAGPTQEEIAQQQAQLAQQQLELDNTRGALADAQITAPFDGMITAVDLITGQSVSSADTAITLVDNSALYVDVDVDELDINQVSVGQSALVYLNAADDATLDGTVTRVSPSGSLADGVVTYGVRVRLTLNPDLTILSGMTGDVEIVIGSIPDALVVPTDAIQRDAGGEYVMVAGQGQNDQGTRVAVTSGETIGDVTVVTGSLTEGQTVYLAVSQSSSSSGGGFPAGPGGFIGG